MVRFATGQKNADRVFNLRCLSRHENMSFVSSSGIQASEENVVLRQEASSEHEPSLQKVQGHSAKIGALLNSFKDVRHGMLIHHYILHRGLDSSLFFGSHLLHMYFRCASPEDAWALSSSRCHQNVYSWNYLIQASVEGHQGHDPIHLFHRMHEEAVLPNRVTYFSLIKGNGSQPVGIGTKRMHACITGSEFGQDGVLGTTLLRLYGQCGRMDDVSQVFQSTTEQDVILWTAMITVLAEQGHNEEAFKQFGKMQQEGVRPTIVTCMSLLAMCANYTALEEGKLIHTLILIDSLESDIAVGNALLYMYGKCACLDDAHNVFDEMYDKNVVTWTSMITIYSQKGYGKAALILFNQMHNETILPNRFTLVSVLVACACKAALGDGRHVHIQLSESDYVDAVVGAALVNMYDKCGSLADARTVFDTVGRRDIVLWNAMIAVYAQNGKLKEAIDLFESMQAKGVHPDDVTFSHIFGVCADCAQQAQGERMHAYIMESGLEPQLIVGNSLIHMYAQCGDLEHARHAFGILQDPDVVSWTVIIAAYTLHGQFERAFQSFEQMQQQGYLPDGITYIGLLDACGSVSSHVHYQQFHSRIEKSEFLHEVAVLNALIKVCCQRGKLQDSEQIFSVVPERTVVTWNSMIGAYARLGNTSQVLVAFVKMINNGVIPDKVTFVSVVSACSGQNVFLEGKQIHNWAVEIDCDSDPILQTVLLIMYGRCGSLEDARRCFDTLEERTVLSWNAMMAVHAQHGQGKEALGLFQKMQQDRLMPDGVSFLAVLAGCSHAGLANEGKELFTSMVKEHHILPAIEHYACLVDLLGRVGRLDEAEALLQNAPSQSLGALLKTMLGACKSNDDANRGDRMANHALEVDSNNPTYYVILSNIYSALAQSYHT